MVFIQNDKFLSKQWFKNYLLITVGSFILASGFVYFIAPYKIVPGGVYGIGIVVHYFTRGLFAFAPEGFPIGLFGLLLNIPLTLIGTKILGPRFGVKTIIGFILTSGFIDLQTYYWGEAPLVPDDALLSSIFGGVLVGLGIGLIFKSKTTPGGSDIVAMMISKYTKLPLGRLLIYIDSVIVLFGFIIFSDWKIPLYSCIVIYVAGKVIDATMQGISYDKAIFIISDKYEEIRDKIIYDLRRGGTLLSGVGMYKGLERKVIFTNVSRRELVILQEYIKLVDPDAFLTVIDANEIIGEGFKPLREL